MLWQNPVWWNDTRIGMMVGLCVALAVVGALRTGAAAFRAEEKEQQARFALWALLFAVSAFFGLAALLLSRIFGLPLHKEIFALFLTVAFTPVVVIFSRWVTVSLGAGLALFVSLCGFTQLTLQFAQVRTATPETLKMLLERGKTEGLRRAALMGLLRERLTREDAYGAAQLLNRHAALLEETDETKIRWNLAIRLANEARSRKDTRLLDVALSIAPDCTPVLVEQMRSLKKQGDLSGAERLARRILTVNPLCCDAAALLIRCALEKGETNSAAEFALKYGLPAEITEKQRLTLAPRIAEKGRWDLLARMLKNARTQQGMLWLFIALSKQGASKADEVANILRKKFPQLAKDVDWLKRSPFPSPAEIKKRFPEANILIREITPELRLLGFVCPARRKQMEEFELRLFLQKTLPVEAVDLMIFLGKLPIYRRLVRLEKKRCGEMFSEIFRLRVPYSIEEGRHQLRVCRFIAKGGKALRRERLCLIPLCSVWVDRTELAQSDKNYKAICSTRAPRAKNLVVNGSFEQPLSIGWRGRHLPFAKFARDSTLAYDGKWSLMAEFFPIDNRGFYTFWQDLDPKARKILLSYVWRAENLHGGAPDILLIARDAQGRLLVHKRLGKIFGTVRTWRKEKTEVVIPKGAKLLRIGLHYHSNGMGAGLSGVIWIDALSVEVLR